MKIELSDEIYKKFDIIRFNINRANEKQMNDEETIELLCAVYWEYTKNARIKMDTTAAYRFSETRTEIADEILCFNGDESYYTDQIKTLFKFYI